ncbi:MAG: putative sugar nucleotidyl transferase [Thermoguttaceae bacterium]|nr:putative sugar nucleotidyl transferase [Thermoguttaceae bacterium]MDW8037070.1 putative sugar nucleotidyl transferase [Thermoguttaceae bacterium]
MRLVLLDLPGADRVRFYPLALSRPIWELRCGITNLAEKLVAKLRPTTVACFVPPYMAEAYREQTSWPVNDLRQLAGDELLLVHPRVKAEDFPVDGIPPGHAVVSEEGTVLAARIGPAELARLGTGSIEALVESAKSLPRANVQLKLWNYIWDLILESPHQITKDFAALGRSGIEGTVEQPSAIRGSRSELYIAPGVLVHPMVVLDAANGPIYIDEGAEIHPFTRIEGPCYIGKKSILLGCKCREGNSIGPVCRVGGEVEESIIQGYSNKYHDGFLGHAYVGEWVNLGALTTNSDLKNDYTNVSVILDGRRPIDTGSTKVGSLIGDHTKTSIGTLLNTGAHVGAMCILAATGKPLPKYIPSFAWFIEGVVTKGFGKQALYETARIAMGRRKRQFTEAQQAMWDAIYELTAPQREEAIRRGRRLLATGRTA